MRSSKLAQLQSHKDSSDVLANGLALPLFAEHVEEAVSQTTDAFQAPVVELDRMRRMSTPGKGNSSMLTAMFEQRVAVATELKQQPPKRSVHRRRVGSLCSARESRSSIPELRPQRLLASSASASSIAGSVKDGRFELCTSALTS